MSSFVVPRPDPRPRRRREKPGGGSRPNNGGGGGGGGNGGAARPGRLAEGPAGGAAAAAAKEEERRGGAGPAGAYLVEFLAHVGVDVDVVHAVRHDPARPRPDRSRRRRRRREGGGREGGRGRGARRHFRARRGGGRGLPATAEVAAAPGRSGEGRRSWRSPTHPRRRVRPAPPSQVPAPARAPSRLWVRSRVPRPRGSGHVEAADWRSLSL